MSFAEYNINSCNLHRIHGLTLTVLCSHVPPPSEQKPKARPQSPAQPRRPRWPPLPGFTGVTGCHVRGRRTYSLHPRQPGSCQPACGAINQPDKGPLTRYASIEVLLYHRNVLLWRICLMFLFHFIYHKMFQLTALSIYSSLKIPKLLIFCLREILIFISYNVVS